MGRELVARFTEADRTFNEIRELVENAVQTTVGELGAGQYLYVQDLADGWVIYNLDGAGTATPGTYRASYSIDDTGKVTLGAPEKVEERKEFKPVSESVDRLNGRVLESMKTGDGLRAFRVQILAYGTSRNGIRYTESVMRKAAPLYDGAKAYDGHRTEAEMKASSITGMVGTYRDVEADSVGITATLRLLPSAIHTAEALDESLAAQEAGLPPVVGISHDVVAAYRMTSESGRRIREATEIQRVASADVVADPSAGGRVTRMVAGGTGDNTEPEGKSMTLKELLALLKAADSAKRAELLTEHATILSDAGLDAAAIDRILTEPAKADEAKADEKKADATGDADKADATKADAELVGAGAVTESWGRDSLIGKQLITGALTEAKVEGNMADVVRKNLPDVFTEGELVRAIESVQSMRAEFEKDGLRPKVGPVTKDEADKVTESLDAMFSGDFSKGFSSFKEAYYRSTGKAREWQSGEDEARMILRECIGAGEQFDSARMTESISSGTFAEMLGDSITRQMVKEYGAPGLDNWRTVVSSIVPLQDFRTQRRERMGGFGVLPTVLEGAPYQPLTSPGDEEATYAPAKYGGTEDVTLETIANDDVGAIAKIPVKLGRGAAITLQRFVWNTLFSGNPTCTYDSVALFHATHANTAAVALAHAGMNSQRAAMIGQAAYGNSVDILSLVPRTLVVPTALEEIGHELCTSQYGIPSTTPGATNVPNIHAGTQLVRVDLLTDANDWFLIADPAACPIIELGFYQGRQDPELFAQTDPNSGAVFNADKLTYKIRHIYGGTPLDHRGVQRGTQ